MNKLTQFVWPLLIVLFIASCGSGNGNTEGDSSDSGNSGGGEAPDGRLVYMDPQPNGNTFACAYCHSLEENDNFIRPGHAIGDAPRRASYKNGQLDNFLSAVNTCLETWMAVDPTELWEEDTPEFVSLREFIEQEDSGSGPAPLLSFERAEPPIQFANNAAVNGSVEDGNALFNRSCALCHGNNAVGTERAPTLQSRFQFENSSNFIAEKVRLSGPFNHNIYQGRAVGGRMPFWAPDRINDDQLTDIIEFLIQLEREDPNSNEEPDIEPDPALGSCDSTHPKIGQVATFTTRDHDVAGTATFVDDCTIRLDNFTFDGNGINVRVYGDTQASFRTGFAMGPNLVRQSGFNNDTVTVRLPEGMTLDDIDYVSIWCIPVQVSFGDGKFQ